MSANFNSSANSADNITSATTNSVKFQNGSNGNSLTLGTANGSNTLVAQNGVLNNGQTTADSNLYLTIPGSSITDATTTGTLNLSNNSTRPQSVWYTVSASGKESNGASPITQAPQYQLTDNEQKNIFAITPEKIPGALNGGVGGVGSSDSRSDGNQASTNVYTTAVGGVQSNTTGSTNGGSNAIPVKAPDTNGLTTGAAGGETITLSQNYLPLGITSAFKDAYFNHNGIIWHYHNGFAAGDSENKGIFIEGYVNAYIGRTIQAQNNGAKYLGIDQWTNQTLSNKYGMTLANGVYDNGNGLTSVGSLSGGEAGNSTHDVYGIDDADLSQGTPDKNTICYPYVSLFGKKVKTGNVASTNPY